MPYLWMLCGSLAFALMGVQVRMAGKYCEWPVTALARAFLPLLFGVILARASGARLVFLRPRSLWIRSIAGSISLVATFYIIASRKMQVADVFTVTNMFPIWVAVLSWPMLGETPPASVWVSVACGVVGVWLIQDPLLEDAGWFIVIAVAASFSTAVAMIGLHRLKHIDIWAIVVHFSGVALAFCVVAFLVHEGEPHLPSLDARTWGLLLGIGVTATVGQLFLTKAFSAGAPGKISVVALAQVVFVLVFEVLLFDRVVDLWTLAGIALVLAPTAWMLVTQARYSPSYEQV